MIGLLFATFREAEPFLQLVKARKVLNDPFEVHEFFAPGLGEDGVALVCGMGAEAAASATQYLIMERHVRIIVNAGICAAAVDEIGIGEIFRILNAREEVKEGSATEERTFRCEAMVKTEALPLAHLPIAHLTTVDTPVFDPLRRRKIGAWGELIDMEGAGVARVCCKHRMPCYLLKGVSDRADKGDRLAILGNIDTVSKKLAHELFSVISEFAPPQEKNIPKNILRLVKAEHTLFGLPLIFSGAWLGAGQDYPSFQILSLIALVAVGAGTIGMAMNRILDRKIDALNPRTADRELPRGRLSLMHAYAVVVFGMALYLSACALIGGLCWSLWPVPLIPLLTYSLLKRYTDLCHFGIGLCLGLGPLGAFVATSGTIAFDASVLYLALFTFCWITGSDIVYALMDIDFDRKAGVHSLPAKLGAAKAQIVAGILHVVALASMVGIRRTMGGGTLAWLGLIVVAVLFISMYIRQIPLRIRFFPISAIAGIAGALVPVFS